MENLNREILKEMKHYVYLLLDPEDNKDEIFYVGEGSKNRVFDHFKEIKDSEKLRKIQKLKSLNLEPKIEILIHGLQKAEAKKIEAAVIDLIGLNKLTNIQGGKHSSKFGRMDLDQIRAKYTKKKANITERVILIKLNQTFQYNMSAIDLYEITRSAWPVSIDTATGKNNVTHAFAVYDGIIQETYNILQWFKAGTTLMKRKHDIEKDISNRWEFIGSISEEMGKKCRYKSVEHYWKKSSEHPHSNPFTYTFDNK